MEENMTLVFNRKEWITGLHAHFMGITQEQIDSTPPNSLIGIFHGVKCYCCDSIPTVPAHK